MLNLKNKKIEEEDARIKTNLRLGRPVLSGQKNRSKVNKPISSIFCPFFCISLGGSGLVAISYSDCSMADSNPERHMVKSTCTSRWFYVNVLITRIPLAFRLYILQDLFNWCKEHFLWRVSQKDFFGVFLWTQTSNKLWSWLRKFHWIFTLPKLL